MQSVNKPTASIIIPVHDDATGLRITLESLSALKTSLDYEVIVCCDGGPSEIAAITQEYQYKLVQLTTNQGSYAARNEGIKSSSADIFAFLDADQRVHPDWLDQGINQLDSADYVGGRISIVVSNPDDSWQLFDHAYAFPVKEYLASGYAPTANLFVNRRAIHKVGHFNPALRSGGDYEFGRRVRAAGLSQKYAENAVTYHPARTRKQQFKKLRRVMGGIADIRIHLDRERWYKVAFDGMALMALAPFETMWRVACRLFPSAIENDNIEPVAFLLIRKTRKLVAGFWLSAAAVAGRLSGETTSFRHAHRKDLT